MDSNFIKENVDLKPFTYFKIGGRARYFAEVMNENDLQKANQFAREKRIPFFILGAASNVLIADSGFDGLLIRMLIRDIKIKETEVDAGAGVPNAVLVAETVKQGLLGFEWAIGIPGTVGGSVRGNAGCFGGEMKDVVARARVYDSTGDKFIELDNAACRFGYRGSLFKQRPEYIVSRLTLKLRKGDSSLGQRMVRHYSRERSLHQDIGIPSAGCVFKNIPWPKDPQKVERLLFIKPELSEFRGRPTIPVSFLIDQGLGLKGRSIGKMGISKRHANYLINYGGATAEDFIMLVGLIKEYVHRKFDLHLEEEVQYVGF